MMHFININEKFESIKNWFCKNETTHEKKKIDLGTGRRLMISMRSNFIPAAPRSHHPAKCIFEALIKKAIEQLFYGQNFTRRVKLNKLQS